MEYFQYQQPFTLESGQTLPELTIAYHSYGQLNANKDNVIWICHALTANSDAEEWWPGMIGKGLLFDTDKHFIICANILGSCYGTTGPLSVNPHTGQLYYHSFPFITIRDMVRAHILLRQHLGINKIYLLTGGSIGGYQALEWTIMEKQVIENVLLLTTSAAESAWGIAVHTAQRLAIEADNTWKEPHPDSGIQGMKAARAIGMLTYRSYEILVHTQRDEDVNKVDGFKASSYINYQGEKLMKRFNAYTYLLSKFGDEYSKIFRPVLAAYTLFLGVKILIVAFKRKRKNKKVKHVGWLAGAGGFLDSFGGGGWGPLVTSTLISKGRTPRYVIGSVSITEFFVTLASALTFFSLIGISHIAIIAGLIIGGMIAAPIAAKLSGKLPVKAMFISVGAMVIIWSLRILIKALL